MGTRKNCPKTPQQMKELWQQLANELNSCRGLTGGGLSSKPMTDFEEMVLSTFGSAAVDRIKNVQSLGLTPIEQAVEFAISSPTGSPLQLCSPVEATPNPEHYPASPSTPSTYLSLENQDASTSVLSRNARSKLISTLIADIPKRNAAEEERRREHREMMQAIQGLTNSITELIKRYNNVK